MRLVVARNHRDAHCRARRKSLLEPENRWCTSRISTSYRPRHGALIAIITIEWESGSAELRFEANLKPHFHNF